MVSLKTSGRAPQQTPPSETRESPRGHGTILCESYLPKRESTLSAHTFIALNDDSQIPQRFYPHIKVHTQDGTDALSLAQSGIPYASPDYRLRSDYLAQTLQIFTQKVRDIVPDGYSVMIDLSPFAGHASADVVRLIRHGPEGAGQSILERHYSPFDGSSLSGIIPSDQARNVILKIEERLFYYTTFLAIKKALENERARQTHDLDNQAAQTNSQSKRPTT